MANWERVSPATRARMAGLMRWFRSGSLHPETECRHALMKRGMSEERANRICAVAKDMALRTTKWRKGASG
jgi:hypothetical protein